MIHYLIFIFLLLVDSEHATVLVVLIIFSLVVKRNTAIPLAPRLRPSLTKRNGNFIKALTDGQMKACWGNPLTEAVPEAHGHFCFKRTMQSLTLKNIMQMSIYEYLLKIVSCLSLDVTQINNGEQLVLTGLVFLRCPHPFAVTCVVCHAWTTFKIWFSITQVVFSLFPIT